MGLQGQHHTAQGYALGDGVIQKEIAPYRGRIIKRFLKVLPLQGADGGVAIHPRRSPGLGDAAPVGRLCDICYIIPLIKGDTLGY